MTLVTDRSCDGLDPQPQAMRFDVHPRSYQGNHYVYAVLSRRARGVSIGINLNPDKICNFRCIYCQVDRRSASGIRRVDDDRLLAELTDILHTAAHEPLGRLVALEGVPAAYQRLADVAFSGDGEPTSHPQWHTWVKRIGELIDRECPSLAMTLITNASLFHRPRVREGLDRLAARGGQVWAKLDAGSEEHYRQVAGSSIPFERILDNIQEEAFRRPLVIQSLFYRLGNEGPPRTEIDAWAQRLADIVAGGGSLSGVQVTTVARKPPRVDVTAIPEDGLEEIAQAAREHLPGIPVETFPARPGLAEESKGGRASGAGVSGTAGD